MEQQGEAYTVDGFCRKVKDKYKQCHALIPAMQSAFWERTEEERPDSNKVWKNEISKHVDHIEEEPLPADVFV